MDKLQPLLETAFGTRAAERASQEPNEFTNRRQQEFEETARKIEKRCARQDSLAEEIQRKTRTDVYSRPPCESSIRVVTLGGGSLATAALLYSQRCQIGLLEKPYGKA